MSRLRVAGLLLLAGCGPFALGAGAAAGLARPAGSGDLSDPTVEIRRNPEPGAPETPPEFVGATSLTLVLRVNKPTVIRLQMLLVIRGSDGVAKVLFGGDAATTATDLDAVLAQCRNPLPDPQSGADPCAGYFREPPTPAPQATGFSITLVNELLTLSGLDDGEYAILVRAFDITKLKAAYDHHDFVVDTVPPGPPTILSIAAPAPRQLRIDWQEAADEGSGVQFYEVHYHVGGADLPDLPPGGSLESRYKGKPLDPQGGLFDSPIRLPASSLTLTMRGLFAGRAHYVQVTAVDFAGNSSRLSEQGERAASTRIGADGLFEKAAAFEAGAMPDRVRVGDFDGDSVRDLAVFHRGTSEVSVLLGGRQTSAPRFGDGTFAAPVTVSVLDGLAIVDIGVADVTGDGRSDIVAAGSIGVAAHVAVVRSVVGGGGGVSLERVQDFRVHADMEPRALVVADMSGDGRPDVLVAGLVRSGDSENSARLHLAGSGGTPFEGAGFGKRITFLASLSKPANAVISGNFDSDDSLPDLVFGVESTLHADHGTGAGMFSGTTTTATTGVIVDLLGAELNGDRRLDLVVTHAKGTFDLLTGAGRDKFGLRFFPPQAPVRLADTGESVVTSGEFNTDGILDLAFAVRPASETDPVDEEPVKVRYGGGSDGRGNATFPLGRGFGVKVAADPPGYGPVPTSIASADFNGDGIADLVVTTPADGQVRVLLGRGARGRGDGTFIPAASLQRTSELLLEAAGDFDGDGILDLAGIQDLEPPFYIFIEKTKGSGADGVGDGSFIFTGLAGTSTPMPGRKRMVAAEVTGEPPMDFLSTNGASLKVTHTQPTGTFTGAFVLDTGVFAPYAEGTQQPPVLADFDRDGNLDVVVATAGGISLFRGKAGQTLETDATPTLTATAQPDATVAGDFDGDRKPDLALLDMVSGQVLHAAGAGAGTDPFAGRNVDQLPRSALNLVQTLPIGKFHTLAAADFDLDGRDDLCLVTDRGDLRVLFWRPGERIQEAAGLARLAKATLVADRQSGRLLRVADDGTISVVAEGFAAPGPVAVDGEGGFAYVIEGGRVLRSDLATGQRAEMASNLLAPAALALDGERLLIVGNFVDASDQAFAGLLAVNLVSGTLSTLSSSGASPIGVGFDFADPSGVALDPAGGKALVTDRALGVLFRVDLTSGDRTVLSGVEGTEARGAGSPALVAPRAAVVVESRALLLDGDAVVEVDLLTGDRRALLTDALLSRAVALTQDRDGDRILLAIASGGGAPSSLRAVGLSTKQIRIAAPDGPFGLPVELDPSLREAYSEFAPTMVRVADINGDGVPDLMVLSGDPPALAAILSVVGADGRPLGTFASPVVTALPDATSAGSMVVGDFNSDGIPDAAVSLRFADTHRIQVFLGGGVLAGR